MQLFSRSFINFMSNSLCLQHFSIDVGKLAILWELKERSIELFKLLQKNQPVRPSVNVDMENKISSYFRKAENIVFTQCVPKVRLIQIFFRQISVAYQ